MIDAPFLEARINDRLSRNVGADYTVSIDNVSASLLLFRLQAERIEVSDHRGDRSPVTVTVDSVRISGINIVRSWWRRGLASSSVTIWGPSVTIRDLPVRHYRAGAILDMATYASARPDRDSALVAVNRSLAVALPFLACGQIEVIDGALSLANPRATDTVRVSADHIDASFDNVLVDTTETESADRLFFCEDFSFSAAGPKRLVGDSLYELQIGQITGSARSKSITLDSASIMLSVSEDEFAARQEHREYSFRTAVRGVTLHGADLARLVRQEFVVEHVEIDSLFFYLFSDKTLPPDTAAKPPLMPHEAFQRIPWYVAVDSLTVRNGEVIYAERAEDGKWPGTVRFTETSASIHNISNDSLRMSPATPAVVYLSGRIEDDAGISVTMNLPLLSDDLTMRYRGVVGPLDPTQLNNMLVNLEGIRINSGTVDSITFEVTVEQGRARGELTAAYRDLHVDVVSKIDSGQGWLKKLKSTIFNFGVLKESNFPEKPKTYEIGKIDYVRKDEDPFFKFIWVSLRGGLFDVTGLE